MGQVFFYSRLDLVENGFPQVESNSKNVCVVVSTVVHAERPRFELETI